MFNLFNQFYKKPGFNLLGLNLFERRIKQISGINSFSIFILLTFLLFALSCNTTEPPIIPPPPPVVKDTITVSIESFTHRSISINVKCTINNVQSSIRIIRELNNVTATIANYPIQVNDTTIIDDDKGTGLLLDTSYT